MSVKRKFNHFLPEKAIDPDLFPIVPIVELAGSHRVLVENHLGVIQYSTEKIGIKMKYGEIQICGCGLTLEHMTRVKLIVTGRIDGICLLRGQRPEGPGGQPGAGGCRHRGGHHRGLRRPGPG